MVGLGGMDLGVGGGPMAPGGAAAARETMFRGDNWGRGVLDGVDISLGIVGGDYGGYFPGDYTRGVLGLVG